MQKTVVIDIVGLSESVIGHHTPFIANYKKRNYSSIIQPPFPALTTSSQSTYVTGVTATDHGIVGNGWYDREESEIKFWKQSDHIVLSEKIWERARRINPDFTCSKMFWWYNMYSDVEFSATPRPQYRADGVKAPDCYTQPAELRDALQEELGIFPLFHFWGPNTSIKSSQWIADAALKVDRKHNPTLTLIYLPHLDYALQKYGPDDDRSAVSLKEIDGLVRQLVEHYENQDAKVILLSEYGINPVHLPIHLNREFRNQGWLSVREENGKELLDAGASKAFVVADHQIAHVYINDHSIADEAKNFLSSHKNIAQVLDKEGKQKFGIDHGRAGDFVLIADDHAWFTYYYWMDDSRAPDFARKVEIHKKPGYDPVEMFMDPSNPLIKGRAAYKLLRKKLGFRYVMDVIPLDGSLISGSHGSPLVPKEYHPVLISNQSLTEAVIPSTGVYDLIWKSLSMEEEK